MMNAEEVVQDWSDLESEGSSEGSELSEESESDESEEEQDHSSPDAVDSWREVTGVNYNRNANTCKWAYTLLLEGDSRCKL